jgi:hypothetical protein
MPTRAFQKGVTRVVLHPLGRLQLQDSPPPPCRESNAGNGLYQACDYVRHRRLEIRDDASAGAVGGSARAPVGSWRRACPGGRSHQATAWARHPDEDPPAGPSGHRPASPYPEGLPNAPVALPCGAPVLRAPERAVGAGSARAVRPAMTPTSPSGHRARPAGRPALAPAAGAHLMSPLPAVRSYPRGGIAIMPSTSRRPSTTV